MLSKQSLVGAISLGTVMAWDGGCKMAIPQPPTNKCDCNANPTVSKFVGCNGETPLYFDDLNDMPNGACIKYVDGQTSGTSVAGCSADSDCLVGLHCQAGMCADSNGVREIDRTVQVCVSPKRSDSTNVYAGCPYGDGDNILKCHKYWIGDNGMEWKRYIQFNPMGKGDTYAWAYDEAVCAVSGNTRRPSGYPWCEQQDGKSAVDSNGNVIDSTCPCTVNNPIAPLNAVPFREMGWGNHMYVHIYDIMYPGYVKPTKPNQFTPIQLARVESENNDFYMKVVNQYDSDILVYMDAPPARKNEYITGSGVNGAKWDGWTGPTKTLRGATNYQEPDSNGDAWVPRITIAPNNDPTAFKLATMRVNSKGEKLGGFYVPKGYHLRIHVADQTAGGWFQTNASCKNTACWGPGVSLWFTRADAYTYSNRDPLLLVEPNVNAFNTKFEDGTIWFDLSAVDGINANLQLRYDRIDRMVSIPLFQTQSQGISEQDVATSQNEVIDFMQ